MILGLDIATKTGWALCENSRFSGIRTGSFKCDGETAEEKARALAVHLIALIKREGVPKLAVIEQPQRNVQPHKKAPSKLFPDMEMGMTINAATALQLNQLVGSAIGVLTGYGVPYRTVAVATWRKGFFPAGQRGVDRQDWKKMAKRQCELLRIPVGNADEAEAVGIAVYGWGIWKRMEMEKISA